MQTDITVNLYGQPTLIQQGNITEKRFYNSYQQLCLKQRPETGIKAFIYNGYGQLEKYAEGLSGGATGCSDYLDSPSSWVSNEYDNLGDKKKQTFADGSPTLNYMLDAQGNLLTLNNGHSNWQYSYNSQHLLESETLTIDSKTYVIDPEYNHLGHLKGLTYGGASLSYSPDALGNPTEVKEGSTSYASNVAYYASGQLKSFNYGNGLNFNQTLNADYQPEYRQVKQNGALKVGQHYQYDNNNNIEYIGDQTDNSKSLSMVYDGLDRLSTANGSWGQGSLSYDVLGNIKSKNLGSQQLTYSYNESSNRLESVTGGYSFSYDDRGNVTNNGKRSFSFNRANQLVNSGTYSYLYDGHNRRVKKSGSSLGYSVYNQAGQLLLTDGPQGTTRYIHLGSELIAKTGSTAALDDKPGYTGHLEDKDLTLTYMQARYYDPVIGRFYSNDPVDMLGHMQKGNPTMGFNRYAYANNNPYKYTDPDGEFIQVLIGAAAGALGEVASQAIEGKGFNGEKIAASALLGGITGGASAVASAGFGKLATIAVDAAMNAVGNAGESLVHDSIDGKAGDLGKALTSAAASVPGLGNSGTMQKIVGDTVQNKLTSQGMNQTAAQAIGASAGAATASTVKAAEKMATEKEQQIEKK